MTETEKSAVELLHKSLPNCQTCLIKRHISLSICMVAVSVVRLVTAIKMKVSYPVDSFDKRMCPLGIIFSFWELTRQTTVSADPPVPADLQNTCENHLSILIGKNRPAFSAILCGCFPDSWPEKSIGHCIVFYHA